MKKNICIFSANYLPNIGGVERFTYYIAKELIKKGNCVTIVTSNVFELPEHETIQGIEIFRLPCINLLNGRFPVLKLNSKFRILNKELKKQKYDLVIVNTRFYIHSLYGVKFAKKQKCKCITIEHGTAHLTIKNGFWDTLGHAYEHLITKFIKMNCKEFYGVSNACCEWSAHFGIKSKGVLYNSIDTSEINELIDNPVKSYRKENNINKDSIVITFTGRLVKEKGILNLIKAFENLNIDNSYLFIAGDGPLLNEINLIKNDRIIFLGKIPFNEIIALLSETDIFCLPSESEGLSTSVLEAVATKCFVITTSHGGSKELVAGENYGIIMDDNSIQEIEHALNFCINNYDYRVKAINNSYNRLLDNFTWDKTADIVSKL